MGVFMQCPMSFEVGLQDMLRRDLVDERTCACARTNAGLGQARCRPRPKLSARPTSSTGKPKRPPSSRANLRARRDSSCSAPSR